MALELLSLPIAALVILLGHELGHAVAALCCGYRRLTLKLSWRHGGSGTVCIGEPVTPGRLFVIAIAGPLASFLQAAWTWHLAMSVEAGAFIEGRLDLLVFSAAAMGVVNLVPMRIGALVSDGLLAFAALYAHLRETTLE